MNVCQTAVPNLNPVLQGLLGNATFLVPLWFCSHQHFRFLNCTLQERFSSFVSLFRSGGSPAVEGFSWTFATEPFVSVESVTGQTSLLELWEKCLKHFWRSEQDWFTTESRHYSCFILILCEDVFKGDQHLVSHQSWNLHYLELFLYIVHALLVKHCIKTDVYSSFSHDYKLL